MIMKEMKTTIIINNDSDDSDFLKEISDYLDVLGSSKRLKILKLIEKDPMDVREISNNTNTTYVNTKKHLDKLLNIGVINKEIGIGKPTVKGVHPVWKYSLASGGLEAILRSLGCFSNFKLELSDKIKDVGKKISEEFINKVPVVRVLGGTEDGRLFEIRKNSINIGRIDQESINNYDPENDIVLSEDYMAITRVSKPHAKLTFVGKEWFIEDCESKGGTYLNGDKLKKYRRTKINDSDMIGLSKMTKGSSGVRLLFNMPP